MGLLTGPLSITRYNVTSQPELPDFEAAHFLALQPGSEVRETSGFVPFEPDAPYEVGTRRYAFRVRIDKLRPDPTALRERLQQLIRSELDATGAAFVGPKKKKQLRILAEEELLLQATPRSKIIEGCLDGDLLYVASTAKSYLGQVVQQLRRIDVAVEPKTPWLDRGEEDLESEIVTTREPGESVWGCRFLRELVGDREVMVEPVSGSVRLKTRETRVTLAGAVLSDLHRYLERGAEVLAAKLLVGDTSFRLEALPYRLNGVRIETGRHEHWIELLDERLLKIAELFDLLDGKYGEVASRLAAA